MAWVTKIELRDADGKLQPTQVVAFAKVFTPDGGTPIIEIDTYGSDERAIPNKQSQTLQFGREAAEELFILLKRTYGF